jgi:hypothetical protein
VAVQESKPNRPAFTPDQFDPRAFDLDEAPLRSLHERSPEPRRRFRDLAHERRERTLNLRIIHHEHDGTKDES